jgi:undecaprenyl pyrophosphate phosphatase UppP
MKNKLKSIYLKIMSSLLLWSISLIAFADGVIPISSNDETASGHNYAETIVTIIQKDILPFVELGAGAAILFYAISGLWKGYKEYQDRKEFDHLKTAIIASVILIVVGGSILYLLDKLRNYQFS